MRILRSRLVYPALVAILAVLLGLSGGAYGAIQSRGSFPEPLHFSSENAHARIDRGLLAVNFEALKKGGKVENIEPQRFLGFPNPENPAQTTFGFAAIVLQLRLFCDVAETGELDNQYWIQVGHEGTGAIPVHHNRVSYRGTAFDGRVHEGNITFQAKFTHRGEVAEGGVRVWGAKLENGIGDPLTNCDSEPGEKSAARGKPFKWRIVGAR